MGAAYEYVFPAICGVQAAREFYISMCPLRLIPKLFLFDEDSLAPELRAQRILNRGRIPEIARYVVENKDSYVFSALTASIDGTVRFKPVGSDGDARLLGSLHVDMNARFIINDGQHRKAAIEQALKEEPGLSDETIPVVFFMDRGLERSQQMFSDLNRHAIRPSRSLGLLYDHRSEMSKIAKLVALRSSAFRDVVEMERSALSERSRKLFTLSAIYSACTALLGDDEVESEADATARCIEYWDEVGMHVREWAMVQKSKMSAGEVRRDFIHSHAVVLQALGQVGNQLLRERKDWKQALKALDGLDWSRSNEGLWEGRSMIGGRVSKTSNSVALTASAVKARLGLDLSPEQMKAEAALKRGQTKRKIAHE